MTKEMLCVTNKISDRLDEIENLVGYLPSFDNLGDHDESSEQTICYFAGACDTLINLRDFINNAG